MAVNRRKIRKKLEGFRDFNRRAYLNPDTFPAWCLAKGMSPDEKARSRFAAEAARQAYSRSIDCVVEELKNRSR